MQAASGLLVSSHSSRWDREARQAVKQAAEKLAHACQNCFPQAIFVRHAACQLQKQPLASWQR